jgi:hypothetical protein
MVGGLTRLSLQDVCREQKPTPSIVLDSLHESITLRRFIVENLSIPLLLDCPSGEHDGCSKPFRGEVGVRARLCQCCSSVGAKAGHQLRA